MPVPFYNLHDQNAEQLAEELIRQIPATTPEWRNPAPGDPGRTLIDLFAWMGDKLLYRINLLPERQRLMFLRLLDMPMRAATPARGLLQLYHAQPKDMLRVDLPGRTLVPGNVEFETEDSATILPLSGAVYVKRIPTDEEEASVSGIKASLQSVYDIETSSSYVTTPLFADGRALADGFDVARETRDQCIWVALLAPEAPEDKEAFRNAVFGRRDAGPILLNMGFAPKLDAPIDTLDIDAPKPRADNWMWQMPTPRKRATGLPEYTTLGPAVSNGTGGFLRAGIIRLVLPDVSDIGLPENDPDVDVLAGVGDRPPRIDDPDIDARLVGWIRLAPRSRSETLPVSWLGINAVSIEQRRSLRNVVIGTAASGSHQVMQLPAQSVAPESLILDVQRGDGAYETWEQTDDLFGHGRTDKIYRLDPEAGTIRFGNGVNGQVPARGAKVRATRLRHGGGRIGNMPAASIETISHPRLKALQPVATKGGEDAETLADAEIRLPSHLRHNDRAVTEQDYKDLAKLTPGVDIARVEIMPRFRPYQRLSDVAGTVSVLIVPQVKHVMAANPRPDRAMLTAVFDYLDARRLMGTELHVIGPEYHPLSVAASVKVREGHEPDKVLAEVENAIRLFLAPVNPGGRDGTGWALGRTVSNMELEVVVAQVQGLEAVYGISLFERGVSGTDWTLLVREPTGQQSLALKEWMLPECAEVAVIQDPNGAPESLDGLINGDGSGGTGGTGGFGSDDATPIPVVPEIC